MIVRHHKSIITFTDLPITLRKQSTDCKIFILWISRNGITVLACHVYLIICSDAIIRAINSSNAYINFAIAFIVTSIGLIMTAHLINKYCPFIIGKNKQR